MPSIVENNYLGEAFGGKIASINFNYSPNSSPTKATVTIISKDGRYIEPELLSIFILPNIKIPMSIIDVQYNDNGTSRVLQIELIDNTSLLLDTNLILINGVHSTGLLGNETTSSQYLMYSDSGYPQSMRNSSSTPVSGTRLQRVKDGVLIGGMRTTIKATDVYNERGNSLLHKSDVNSPYLTSVYDNGVFNNEVSTCPPQIRTNLERNKDQYETLVEFGYTIKDLKGGLLNLGIRVVGLTDDSTLFFNSSGTVRSVLSSVLSSLGLSFYIDVFSGTINIINASHINNINNNVKLLYENLNKSTITDDSIVSANIKKTMNGVSGRYGVYKGDLNVASNANGGGGGGSSTPPTSKMVFYKFDYDYVLSRKEKVFFSKILPLFWFDLRPELINNFIYALAAVEDPIEWSDQGLRAVYGGQTSSGDTMINRLKQDGSIKPSDLPSDDTPLSPSVLTLLELFNTGQLPFTFNRNASEIFIFPRYKNGTAGEPPKKSTNLTAEVPYERIKTYIDAVTLAEFGLYITSGVSRKRALSANFNLTSKIPTVLGPFSGDELIANVPELLPLQVAVNRLYPKSLIKIADLARKAGAVTRDNTFHFIGIRDYRSLISKDDVEKSEEIKKSIESNMFTIEADSQPSSLLVVTRDGARETRSIARTLQGIVSKAKKNIDSLSSRRISLDYIRTDPRESDGSGGGGDSSSDNVVRPEYKNIFSQPSRLGKKTQIELDFYEGSAMASEALFNNIQFFSPEQGGPFYEANVSYARPPLITDMNINNGFSSLTSSISESGVTTSISYSTVKYNKVDRQFVDKLSINSTMRGPLSDSSPAFIKNKR